MIKKTILLLSALSLPLASYAETLKVASWNLAWLGSHNFNHRTDADYEQLAMYANQLDADVIALQETESGYWASKVFGDDYDYYFSTRNNVQSVGVAVKKSSGYKVLFKEDKALGLDGSVRYGVDLTLSKGNKALRLLAVHLKSGCFDAPLDKSSVDAIGDTRKRKSCAKLSRQIEPLESWIDSRATEPLPFIVLGDFNRRLGVDIDKGYSEEQGFWQAIDDEGEEDLWSPTVLDNAESKCWGGYYKDYIDHIILSKAAKGMYVDNSFKQLIYQGRYSKDAANSLSDHCPISIELNL